MSDNSRKMVDSITIKHLENGTFKETTVYKDGSNLIELFDEGILISSTKSIDNEKSSKLTQMLKKIKITISDEAPDRRAKDILAMIRDAQQQPGPEKQDAKTWINNLINKK